MKSPHVKYIKHTFKLALKGAGNVSPNPLVGAVIVENNKIISESYHKKYGELHAERNAINKLPKDYDFSNSTIYINLEPCTHYGKTPPCCDFLIEKKFDKVVFAITDPNSLVAGKSIEKLKLNNINYEYGILEKKAKYLNRFFIKHITTKMPFITLKAAQTLNGKISSYSYNSKWISNPKSLKDVHKLRSYYDAVLVGTNTIIKDLPNLNVRLVKGRNPKRILLDRKLKLDYSQLINDENIKNTFIVTSDKNKDINLSYNYNLIYVPEIDNKLDLYALFKILGDKGINSILVETGSVLSSYLLDKDLIDEILLYNTPKILGKGISLFDESIIESPNMFKPFNLYEIKRFDDDLRITYTKEKF